MPEKPAAAAAAAAAAVWATDDGTAGGLLLDIGTGILRRGEDVGGQDFVALSAFLSAGSRLK